MPVIVLIAAVAENGVIGRGNGLPWRLKSDMRHFRQLTMGKPVVMGRKTYCSIGKALPGRTTIVVSRDRTFTAAGVLVAPNLEAALAAARGDALRRRQLLTWRRGNHHAERRPFLAAELCVDQVGRLLDVRAGDVEIVDERAVERDVQPDQE